MVLVEELNCVACHQAEGTLPARSKTAPRLADVGSRVNPAFMEAFIRDPHGTKPGTTMPDVLARLPDDEKQRKAEALTHFLLSLKTPDFAPQAPDPVAAVQGTGCSNHAAARPVMRRARKMRRNCRWQMRAVGAFGGQIQPR